MKNLFLLLFLPFCLSGQIKEGNFSAEIKLNVNANYLISFPDDYNKEGKSWPLMIFLHGAGERGTDLNLLKVHGPLKYIEQGNKIEAVVLAPQCPADELWNAEVLNALIESVMQSHNIDKDRVYLTGLSMGGMGTWDLALKYPERFAALAPICGPIQYNFPRKVNLIKDKPIWVFHGAKDNVVPISTSEAMVAALKAAGGNPEFTVYPDAGHDSWSVPYADPEFYKWMLSKKAMIRQSPSF